MRLEHHILISAGTAGIIWAVTRSAPMVAASLISGILMDADHVLDYFREFGWRLNLRKLFAASYERTFQKSWLILHAWEWLALWVPTLWLFHSNPWIWGAFIGWCQHMAVDQLVNTPNPWAYFILWRWRQGFDHRISFPFHEKRRNDPGAPRKDK